MWGPISEALLERIVDRVQEIGLGPGSRVLDLGCGPAELLRRIVARTGARGLGIDRSSFALEEARRRLDGRPEAARVELREGDVTTGPALESFDLVLCVGPGWDHAGWAELTAFASSFAEPTGHLVLADGAWRSVPEPADLDALGMEADDYPLADGVERLVRRGGAEPIWTAVSTPADWQAYGAAYRGAMLDFLQQAADDPIAALVAERSGPGWDGYERLHRMLDFVIVLAQRSATA